MLMELDNLNEKEVKAFFSKNQNVAKYLATNIYSEDIGYCEDFNRFIRWEDNYWKVIHKERKCFYEYFGNDQTRSWTVKALEDVITHLSFQITKRVQNFNTPYITLNNGMLNSQYFIPEELDKYKYPFLKIDVSSEELVDIDAWNVHDTNSKFSTFLKEIMIKTDGEYDPELEQLLQECCGYVLYPENKEETCFFFKGEGANGKGVIMYLIEKIIGSDFVSSANIESLSTDKFAAAELIGKKLNICSENESERVDSARLKLLISSSADKVSIQQKFKDAFSVNLNIKFIFSTNDFPKFASWDNALMRRLKIIPFNYNVPKEKRDTDLKSYLINEEKKVITKWFMQGLWRLIKNKKEFTYSKQSADCLEVETENNVPSIEFMKEYITFTSNDNDFITKQELYTVYNTWCKDTGRKAVGIKKLFKEIRLFFKLEEKSKYKDSKKHKSLSGIVFKTDIPDFINPDF